MFGNAQRTQTTSSDVRRRCEATALRAPAKLRARLDRRADLGVTPGASLRRLLSTQPIG